MNINYYSYLIFLGFITLCSLLVIVIIKSIR